MMSGGAGAEPLVAPERGDRRFNAAEWRDNPAYSLLKQSYLLNSRLFTDVVEAADLDEATKHKLRFYTRQFVDAMSPANFAATNPDVLKAAFESKGESVKAGFENLLADMRKGGLTITDESAFEIGKTVAVSEGAVIFENESVPADPVRAADRAGGKLARCSSCRRASTSSTSSTCSPRTPSFASRPSKVRPCSWCPGAIPTRAAAMSPGTTTWRKAR